MTAPDARVTLTDGGGAPRDVPVTIGSNGWPICGVGCYGGGSSATRKYTHQLLPVLWHCNRRVKAEGLRCYQHAKEARRG